MGKVEAKVILTNYDDESAARRGFIKPEEIRKVETVGLVDTGATRLVLPKDIVNSLGLTILRKSSVQYGDDRVANRDIAGVVAIQVDDWVDRVERTECIVEETGTRILIGQLILEGMDLYVDCKLGKLIPRPGYEDTPLMEIL